MKKLFIIPFMIAILVSMLLIVTGCSKEPATEEVAGEEIIHQGSSDDELKEEIIN